MLVELETGVEMLKKIGTKISCLEVATDFFF